MTVQEMIEDVYLRLGNPTWLSPYNNSNTFDINQSGAQTILGWLNRGYNQITNWKLSNGTIIRFPSLLGRCFLKVKDVSATVQSSGDDTVTLGASLYTVDDKYVEWIIDISGAGKRTIISYDGATRQATVDRDWDSNPNNGDSATLYKRFFKYKSGNATVHSGEELPKTKSEITSFQRALELNTRYELARRARSDTHISTEITRSRPTVFWQREDGVEFDTSPTNDTTYEFLYYGAPETLSTAGQIPDIPESWHEGIVIFAIKLGLEARYESDMAYAQKRNLIDFMQTGQQPMERAFEREDAYLEWEQY